MSKLLHITSVEQWAISQSNGMHTDPSLESEGFIHCSGSEQVSGTASRFFEGRTDLLLLEIDPAALSSPLVYEDSYGHGEFPHLYGPLNLDAVVDAVPFPPGDDGSFRLPPSLID